MSSAFLNIATKAAYLAANIIQQGSRNLSSLKIQQKSDNDFVTEFDQKSEAIIIKTILQAFPEHNVLGEESGNLDKESDFTWIIDPIDGTTNFMHGYPHYCVSIALKHKSKIVLGVILDPNRNDLYCAEAGKGSYRNDKRIRVSSNSLEHSLVATGFPNHNTEFVDQYLIIFKDMLLKTGRVRSEGSAALNLAYVASGMLDGFWEYSLKSWDVAAGIILVKEAGGIVKNFDGATHTGENGAIIAANTKIIAHIQKIINTHYKKQA